MNYNSIQEILSAGTTNMEVLRNNTKQDDGTDTITGVSWFNYNGNTVSTIYANGNSFIGFGTSTEHLKVNRRDGALYSLYREEGTLCDCIKFLKIRWKGYSAYNKTASTYCVEYDVILWDTGDISLHMISIPTTSNDGIYSLVASSTYNYTVSTSNPDVTFTKTDSGFSVSNNLIDLPIPYYLIRSEANYYTVVNNELSKIETAELTSEVFLDSGVHNIPSLSLLIDLNNPEVLIWASSDRYQLTDGIIVKGAPIAPQIIYYDIQDMTEHAGIKNAACDASSDVLFTVSVDDGQTWKYYSDSVWYNAITDLDGMNADTLISIMSDEWSSIITSSTPFKFRCVLTSATSYASDIYINYNDV